MRRENRVRNGGDPFCDGVELPDPHQSRGPRRHDLGRKRVVTGGQGIGYGREGPVVVGEPAGGVQLQRGNALRRQARVVQLRVQEFPEERMITIPGAVIVDALKKQVVALGRGDAFTAVGDFKRCVAHGGRKGVEQAGREQEIAQARGKPGKDVFCEVVGDVT